MQKSKGTDVRSARIRSAQERRLCTTEEAESTGQIRRSRAALLGLRRNDFVPLGRTSPISGVNLAKGLLLLASPALSGTLGADAAHAACTTDFCWNAPTGVWSVGTNWTAGGPPASGNTVTINNGGTATVDSTNAQSSNATIDGNSTVVVSSGGSWTNNGNSPGFVQRGGAITIGETNTGTLTIDNGGTVNTTGNRAGSVLVGDQAGSSGTITLGNGGSGTASLINSGPVGYPGNFYIGYGGDGTVNVNANSMISGFDGMTLGVLAGSSGTVTVNAGSLTGGGTMVIGDQGLGTLTIENGGTVTGTAGLLGVQTGSSGSSVTVTGAGSSWTLSGGLEIGINANAALTIASGGAVNLGSSQQIYLGNGNGNGSGSGTLTVNGGTLSDSGGQIFVGSNGSGTSSLLIENGGVVTTTGFAAIGLLGGAGTTSAGSVTVTGPGSSWNIGSGFLEIENLGTVTGLTVQNGASLTSGETLIGGYIASAGNNAMVVTGSGTTWQSGAILLGSVINAGPGSGTGTLAVTSGAHVSASGNVDIGYSPDGGSGVKDSIAVDGGGSKLTTTSNVRVGYYGTGALTVSNGALVSDIEGDIGYSSTNAAAAGAIFSGATTPTNSVGSVLVTGAGSMWTNTTLIVGDNATVASFPGTGTGTSTGTLTISDGGEVSSTNAIIVGANAGATGTINIGAAAGQSPVAPGTISAPAIQFGAGGGTIVFNHSSTDYVFVTPIEGAGSVDVESGTTVLTATNTYTGATNINGGTLNVAGAITGSSGVTVNAGGTLDGTGSVGATTINNGGTFMPGNGTPGSSMTISGSLALSSGAFYLVQINPSTSSFANVTGTATLGGATVNAVYANGSYVAKQYAILTAGSVSGTFNPAVVNTNLPSDFHTTLSYDTHDAYLNLALNFGIPGGLNGNQQNVGNALTYFFNATGGIPIVFGALTPAALTQASGETATGSQQTTFDAMNQFMGVMTDPFIAGRGDGFGASGGAPSGYASTQKTGAARDANAMFVKAPVVPFEQRWSTWTAGFGGSQTTDGNAAVGSNSTTSSIAGTAVGADYRFSPDTIAGFALAGGGTSFGVAGSGSGHSDLFQAGAFVRHNAGPAYITAALAYGWQDITTNRTVTIAGIDQLQARFNANAFSGRAEGGYRFVSPWIGGIGITPYAAAQFTTFDLPAYAEQALIGTNNLALAYGAKSVTDPRSELGFRTDKSFAMPDGVLTLRGRLAWAHDYDTDRSIGATFQTLPGASFVVNGAAQASDSVLTTASIERKWTNNWSIAATFEGEFSNVTNSYAGKGVVRYQW
jgi:T5SS/PEP-CTERM-associated repeat protein